MYSSDDLIPILAFESAILNGFSCVVVTVGVGVTVGVVVGPGSALVVDSGFLQANTSKQSATNKVVFFIKN